MEKWVIAAKRADFNQIGQQFHIDPVIARLIRNRDVIGEDKIREYLSGTVQELPSPWLMKDMEKAVDILEKKISQKAKVRIIGDYDIDGVTSTYILMKGLARIGADVDTYIPDRVADGYGIHAHLIERAETDRIDTIVTCDNGIAAAAEIQMAKDKGMTVIITDHHEVPYREEKGERQMVLPPADAILNPKQYDCPYPNKNLCGAVVAFKYIAALYERFGVPAEELEDYYELAAIATVGDVMDLQGENRILVKEGLRRLKNTKNQGLQELIRANSLEDAKITAYHIGFVLGPCINASGRLDTAARSLALLNAKTKEEAARLAGDLTALNQSRKALTEKGKEEAIRIIETTELKNDRVLVVYLPDCHESLAGIIAGRIREKYHRPAFVLTGGETSAKGSGRSIESYSMYEELVKCADLMIQFGGHPMAAGLSIEEKNIEEFMTREHLVTFDIDDYVDDVKETMSKIRHRDFPILDENGNYLGMVSRRNLMSMQKKQIILVDHNEKSQAVDNINEAEILEIIDHHRLGSLETISPVYFRNQPLGCTSTIIYQMFGEKNIEIPQHIAGLLLSAILSDTLMFRSPTCTQLDILAAEALAKIAKVDIETHAKNMFKAGSDFKNKTTEEIFYSDFKIFHTDEFDFGVAQISAMSREELDKVAEKLRPFLKEVLGEKRIDMVYVMLTDILEESSRVIFEGHDAGRILADAFEREENENGILLEGIISRKKQLIPTLMNAMAEKV